MARARSLTQAYEWLRRDQERWRRAESFDDLLRLNVLFLQGKLAVHPGLVPQPEALVEGQSLLEGDDRPRRRPRPPEQARLLHELLSAGLLRARQDLRHRAARSHRRVRNARLRQPRPSPREGPRHRRLSRGAVDACGRHETEPEPAGHGVAQALHVAGTREPPARDAGRPHRTRSAQGVATVRTTRRLRQEVAAQHAPLAGARRSCRTERFVDLARGDLVESIS
jgi:hypothetical protein